MRKSNVQMKSRLSYAAGAFGNDVFYATLSTYFIMFVTTHLFNTGDPKQNSPTRHPFNPPSAFAKTPAVAPQKK